MSGVESETLPQAAWEKITREMKVLIRRHIVFGETMSKILVLGIKVGHEMATGVGVLQILCQTNSSTFNRRR